VARVSRFDRQLRYYSEALKLASVLSESWWAGFCGKSELQNLGPNASEAQNAAPNGAASRSCVATGLPNHSAGGCPPHLLQVIRPVYPLRVRSLAVALAGACCSWLTDLRQPVHHWHPSDSNWWAVRTIIYFQSFTVQSDAQNFGFQYAEGRIIQKTIVGCFIAGNLGRNGFPGQPE